MENRKVAIIDHVGIKAGLDFYDTALLGALSDIGYETFLFSNFLVAKNKVHVEHVFDFRENENVFSILRLLKNYNKAIKFCLNNSVTHCIVHGFRYSWFEKLILKRIKKRGIKILLIVHDIES